jgi:hypothetical protein
MLIGNIDMLLSGNNTSAYRGEAYRLMQKSAVRGKAQL